MLRKFVCVGFHSSPGEGARAACRGLIHQTQRMNRPSQGLINQAPTIEMRNQEHDFHSSPGSNIHHSLFTFDSLAG
jgi:hypothetical protein